MFFLTINCKNDNSQLLESQKRTELKQDSIFKSISKSWHFDIPKAQTKANDLLETWTQWKEFTFELSQKPGINLENFRKKSEILSQKVGMLLTYLPADFQKPEIKSRVLVLQTNIHSLEIYLSLDAIPVNKVTLFCNNINAELNSIIVKMDEVFLRAEIPLEEGELETRQQLQDTTRLANKIPPKDLDFE